MKPAATPPRSLASPPPVVSSNVPVKPAEEDRIEPAQSAYSPVSLPAPKKLKNPFAAMEQQSQQTFSPSTSSPSGGAKKLTWSERQALAKKRAEEEDQQSQQTFSSSTSSPSGGAKTLTWSERQALAKKRTEEEEQQSQQTFSPSTFSSGGAKKLTWSERQALAKKRAEEEEAKSRSASAVPSDVSPVSKPAFKSNAPTFGRATGAQSASRNLGIVGAALGVGAVAGVTTAAFSARSVPPAPVAAPSSYTSARDAVRDAAWGTEEEAQTAEAELEPAPEPEPKYEPEPEAAPEPQYQAVSIFSAVNFSAE